MPLHKVAAQGRHPVELALLVYAFTSGLVTLFGVAPRPGSITAQVDHFAALAWSVALVLGSGFALLGVAWPRPSDQNRMSVTGLVLEQVGLVILGGVTAFYAVAAMLTIGAPALIAAGYIGVFAWSFLWRAWQIQKVLRQSEPGGCRR